MKLINGKEYYKMSELVEQSGLSNFTISFYNKKGLLPHSISTSKNMRYYPKITLTVLNLIVYLKENLNFSIDYIKELFAYHRLNFEHREELIVQSIKMLSYEITDPVDRDTLDAHGLQSAIEVGLLEDKALYYKTEIDVFNTFNQLKQYDISLELIKAYLQAAHDLAKIERQLSDKIVEENGFIPEMLVFDILGILKPYIFNKETIKYFETTKDIQ
jgi:DNA-binding transcriptional MerR regulator